MYFLEVPWNPYDNEIYPWGFNFEKIEFLSSDMVGFTTLPSRSLASQKYQPKHVFLVLVVIFYVSPIFSFFSPILKKGQKCPYAIFHVRDGGLPVYSVLCIFLLITERLISIYKLLFVCYLMNQRAKFTAGPWTWSAVSSKFLNL